MCLHITNNHKP